MRRAKGVPGIPADAITTKITGIAHTYYSKKWQRWIVRSLPKSQGADSEYRKLSRANFARVVALIKDANIQDLAAADEATVGTPYLIRDFLFKAATGTLIEFTDTNGRAWMGTRDAIQNIQPMLDSISAEPGTMLFRGPNFWAAIYPPTGDSVLFWSDEEKIAWWSPFEEAVGTLLDSIDAGQGALLYRGADHMTVLNPGTVGQVLATGGEAADPQWVDGGGLPGAVLIGVGVPTSIEVAGTLYSRSDEPEIYSSQEVTSGGAVVQALSYQGTNSTPGAVTLDAAPTAGNLIIAYIQWGNGQPLPTVNASGWTQFITVADPHNPSDYAGFGLYRYAQSGDSATLPAFCTSGSTYWGAQIWEVSGVSGTFAADVPVSAGYAAYGNVSAAGPIVTTTAGMFCLAANGQYNGASVPVETVGGWTLDSGNFAVGIGFGSTAGFHQSVSVSGTSVSASFTNDAGSSYINSGILLGLAVSTTTTQSWVLVGHA